MKHKNGYYFSTEAVSKNLLLELVEKGKMSVKEYQHDIPQKIFDDILKLQVEKDIVHIKDNYVIVGTKNREKPEKMNPRDFFDGNTLISKKLGEYVKCYHMFKTSRETDEIFFYEDGVYKSNAESIIKEEVSKLLEDLTKKHYANEVLHYIQTTTYMNKNDLPLNLVNIKNGYYNLKDDSLLPHDCGLFTITQLPIIYNPDADCIEIKKFLSEVLHEDDIPKMQEFIGYCLYRSHPIQKYFLLVGDGANGKSTFLSMLSMFLSKENISGIGMQEFDISRFALAGLYGKLANIYDDLPKKALRTTGRLKMVTGGSPIEAEQKFKAKRISFINFAKMIFSCNAIPESSGDDSHAFYRRLEIITFPNQFTGKDCDPRKLEKITTEQELSGLLNFALIGLKRLLDNGEFTNSKTVADTREQYVSLSNPAKGFLDAKLEIDFDEMIGKSELYQKFVDYCHDKNLPTITKETFGKKVVECFGSSVQSKRIRDANSPTGRKTVWKNIKFIDNGQSGHSGHSISLS